MIITPENWAQVGQPVTLRQLDDTLEAVLAGIDCDCLSYSGGIDSSLLLYHMLKAGKRVRTFTMASSPDHPDIEFARAGIRAFEQAFGTTIESQVRVAPNLEGDALVAAFYSALPQWTDRIVTGDGVDEFMAGYYTHQAEPTEEVYYNHLRNLQQNHLAPLNENSGSTQVYVPYIDPRFICLMAQIPLSDKVGPDARKRIMMALAQGKVPTDIIERRKYGFGTPFSEGRP